MKEKRFSCHCDKSFTRKWGLERHQRSTIACIRPRKNVCQICGKEFNHKGNKNRHEIVCRKNQQEKREVRLSDGSQNSNGRECELNCATDDGSRNSQGQEFSQGPPKLPVISKSNNERVEMDAKIEVAVDNIGPLFRFIAHYQQKEFIGQKAFSQDIEEEVAGETRAEVLNVIWQRAQQWVKREILVDVDKFAFAENENPTRDEIGNYVIFQDKISKKNYTVRQLSSNVLRKMRDKHVNVMVHIYGNAIATKSIHQKMTSAILTPSECYTAGPHSTLMLTDLARKLKAVHGTYLSGNMASWTMWANAVHAAPVHRQAAMINDLPPAHLIHLFGSVSTDPTEVMRSAKNGLQIAGNLNDLYEENIRIFRQEFNKLKEATLRAFDVFEVRLTATEEMLASHRRLDGALHVEGGGEPQITDLVDVDDNQYLFQQNEAFKTELD